MATTYLTRNSVYEVDEDAKQVRRLRGINAPTSRFHPDGKWREYAVFYPPKRGGPLGFQWADGAWTLTGRVLDQEPS